MAVTREVGPTAIAAGGTPNVGTGTNRVMVVTHHVGEGFVPSAMTQNGQALTLLENSDDTVDDIDRVSIWAIATPQAGTFSPTAVAPVDGPAYTYTILNGVDISGGIAAAVRTSGNDATQGTTMSIALASLTIGDYIFIAAVDLDGDVTHTASNCTELADAAANGASYWIAELTADGTSETVGCTAGSFLRGAAVAFIPAAEGATGTIASTITKTTASLTGSQTQTGTLASTLQAALMSATGVMQPEGAIVATLQAALFNGNATVAQFVGTLASTLQAATASLTGAQTQSGTIAATLQAALASLTGAQSQSGELASTLQALTASLTGAHSQSGTLAGEIQEPTAAFTGSQVQTGTLAATLTAALFSGQGAITQTGAMIVVLQALLFSGEGSSQFIDNSLGHFGSLAGLIRQEDLLFRQAGPSPLLVEEQRLIAPPPSLLIAPEETTLHGAN